MATIIPSSCTAQVINLVGTLSYNVDKTIFVVLTYESRDKLLRIYAHHGVKMSAYKLKQPLKIKLPRGMAPDIPGIEYTFVVEVKSREFKTSSGEIKKFLACTLHEAKRTIF